MKSEGTGSQAHFKPFSTLFKASSGLEIDVCASSSLADQERRAAAPSPLASRGGPVGFGKVCEALKMNLNLMAVKTVLGNSLL